MLGFLLAATPYLISQKTATGRWSLGAKTGMNLRLGETVGRQGNWGEAYDKAYFTLSEDGTKLSYQYMVENDEGTIAYVLSHPKELVRRYIVNLHLLNKYVIPGVFYPIIIILFAAGLFFTEVSDLRQKSILFLPIIPYLALPFFIVADRYFLPFIPIVLIWSSKGIIEVSNWLIKLFENSTNKYTRHILRQDVLIILITAIVLSTFIPQTFRPFLRKDTQKTVYREIGIWMKANLPQGSKLLSRKQRVPFYSGMEQVPLPFASWNMVLEFAKLKNADYFLADQNVLKNRPSMQFLFAENFDSDQIQRIKEFEDASQQRIYVYKILY